MLSKIYKLFIIILNILAENKTNKIIINDKEIIVIISEIIKIIIKIFENIISNEEKYYQIRKIQNEINGNKNHLNKCMVNMALFLKISLFIEPFKTEFFEFCLKFLFDILFPLIITLDEEKYYMEQNPELYQIYFNEVINNDELKFLNLNFRAIICTLIIKVFENIDSNSKNNLCFYIIEIFEKTMNNEIIKDNKINEKYKISKLFELLNQETKIDLCLLIIILLRKYLNININLRNKIIKYYIFNQNKIHSFNSKLIIIKVCILYEQILPYIFFYNEEDKYKLNYELFVNNAVLFLLNNLLESKVISNISLSTIIQLIDLFEENSINNHSKEFILFKEIFFNCLNNNFNNFYKIMELNNIPILFYVLTEKILKNIIIKESYYIILLLNKLSKKLFLLLNTNKNRDELNEIFSQIFNIFIQFLEGKNNLILYNKENLNQFNNILHYINSNFNDSLIDLYFDKLVNIEYLKIKITEKIDDSHIIFFKKIITKIQNEEKINEIYYNFISIIISIININNNSSISKELLNQILGIINKSFSFSDINSIKFALLLTLQIFNEFNNLNNDIIKLLLYQSLELNNLVNEYNEEIINLINILTLSIICSSIIFHKNEIYKIINEKDNNKFEEFILILDLNEDNDYWNYFNIYFKKFLFFGLYFLIKNKLEQNMFKNNIIKKNIIKFLSLLLFKINKNNSNSILNVPYEINNEEINFTNQANILIKKCFDKNNFLNELDENILFKELKNYIQAKDNELFNKF